MMGQRVRNLMGEHSGQLVIVLDHRKKTCKDGDLAARQTESINLLFFEDIDFPFKAVALPQVDFSLQGFDPCRVDDAPGNATDASTLGPVNREHASELPGVAQDFLISLAAKCQFLLGTQRQGLGAVPGAFTTTTRVVRELASGTEPSGAHTEAEKKEFAEAGHPSVHRSINPHSKSGR